MFNKILFTVVVSCFSGLLYGQHHCTIKDSNIINCKNLQGFFIKGRTSGHLRNFFLTTQNKGKLSDYWANATGGALSYETMRYKGLKFGVKGIFTFNTASNDLTKIDPISNKHSKYEIELFDINRPEEKYDLDRLEELYINYKKEKIELTFGRQTLNTPLVNLRDGRMKPFVFSGLYSTYKLNSKTKIQLGWIHSVSPRSTTHFYSLEEAINQETNRITNNNENELFSTKGLAIAAVNFRKNNFHFQTWNYLLTGLNNTVWNQLDWKNKTTQFGLQYIYQSSLQKNTLNYFQHPNRDSHTLSARFGKISKHLNTSLNFTKILKNGPFLFPKSLGREFLYSTMTLFWIEGKGDVNVVLYKFKYQLSNSLELAFNTGQFFNLKRNDDINNIYNQCNHRQYNTSVKHHFHNKWKGLSAQLLYIHRHPTNNPTVALENLINKNSFHQIHFITNIEF